VGDGLPMVSEAVVHPAPSATSASMQDHGDQSRAGHRALHVAQAPWLLQVSGAMEVSRHEEDVGSEAMMDTITEALVLAPFAGVLGGMLWVLYDQYTDLKICIFQSGCELRVCFYPLLRFSTKSLVVLL